MAADAQAERFLLVQASRHAYSMWLAPCKFFDFPDSFFDFCDLVLTRVMPIWQSAVLSREDVLKCHSTFEHHAHVVPCAHNA
jgi:hypothetical protein